MISWDAWHLIDSYVSLWGGVGGFVATEIKRREAKYAPTPTQPKLTRWERTSDCIWNILLGALLVHLYTATGSVLNIFSATVTGGSAPLILKSLFSAPRQLPGNIEPDNHQDNPQKPR